MSNNTMAEARAFMSALEDVDPNQMTKCADWTAHELVAHLAAGAAEIARNVDAFNQGGAEAVPATRDLEAREAPYRDMEFSALRTTLAEHQDKMMNSLSIATDADPGALTPWSGRQMPIAAFFTHVRSEYTLHRWDLVGDDETSDQLLAQPELTAHAILALGASLVGRGAASGASGHVRLHSSDQPDILVSETGAAFTDDQTNLDSRERLAIIADPAARLLLLWGRTPDQPGRVIAPGGLGQLRELRGLLAGY